MTNLWILGYELLAHGGPLSSLACEHEDHGRLLCFGFSKGRDLPATLRYGERSMIEMISSLTKSICQIIQR